jgi:cystathionine gamma-lyase
VQGFEYSHSGNPNRNALESTLASLESGGAHGLAFLSGSATTTTVLQSLGPGSHILSVNDVYGGTRRYYMTTVTAAQGLEVSFLDMGAEETIMVAIQPNTKVCKSWLDPKNQRTDRSSS